MRCYKGGEGTGREEDSEDEEKEGLRLVSGRGNRRKRGLRRGRGRRRRGGMRLEERKGEKQE